MEKNEEMIEEIVDIEDEIIEEPKGEVANSNDEGKSEEKTVSSNNVSTDLISKTDVKKKSKVVPLIILFTLLILDIAAIAIYIIGIDKVLSFIK